jgi:lipopolysaccharide transport system ATP-binding protein
MIRAPLSSLAETSLRREAGKKEVFHQAYFWALEDINFEIGHGTALGIIGQNGAGKSILLKILARITKPTRGFAEIYGRTGALLEVGTGFHPELTGRENIFLSGVTLGMKRAEIKKKFDEIVAFSEVEKFLDTPVKRYSDGMHIRLGFAVAAHIDPEILLIDEILSVADRAFQSKCVEKIKRMLGEGRTIIMVSHQMPVIEALCTRVIELANGHIHQDGPSQEVISKYISEDASAR